jgi:hypothetical protein
LKDGHRSEPIVIFHSTLSVTNVFGSPAMRKKKRFTHLPAPSQKVTYTV